MVPVLKSFSFDLFVTSSFLSWIMDWVQSPAVGQLWKCSERNRVKEKLGWREAGAWDEAGLYQGIGNMDLMFSKFEVFGNVLQHGILTALKKWGKVLSLFLKNSLECNIQEKRALLCLFQ